MGFVALLGALSGLVGGAIFHHINGEKDSAKDYAARNVIRALAEKLHGSVSFSDYAHGAGELVTLPRQWLPSDLEDLDRKFDALCEYLGVEFVQEKVSDGGLWADREGWYCRKKKPAPKNYKKNKIQYGG